MIDKNLTDIEELIAKSKKFIERDNLQLAEIALSRALEIDNEDKKIIELYEHTNLLLENYTH